MSLIKHHMQWWSILLLSLICVVSAQADAQPEWWDSAWWSEGQLPVPDNYGVQVERFEISTGEVDVPVFMARPDAQGDFPGVLYVHGRRGVDPLLQGHVRRLAARGFVVYAPDLYQARFIEAMPIEHDYVLEADLNEVLNAIIAGSRHSGNKVCVYSHTRGGYLALKLAVTFERQNDALACYVSYYPHMQDPNAPEPMQVYRYALEADQLRIPSMMFVGENEQYQRKRGIDTAVESMRDKGLPVQLFTYPGIGRGFDFRDLPIRTFADDLATRDALQRSSQFMHQHLRP